MLPVAALLVACAGAPAERPEPSPAEPLPAPSVLETRAHLPPARAAVAWAPRWNDAERRPAARLVEVGPDAIRLDGQVAAPLDGGWVPATARTGLRVDALHQGLTADAEPVLLAVDAGVPVGALRAVLFTLLVSGRSDVRVWVDDPDPEDIRAPPAAARALVVSQRRDGPLRAGLEGESAADVPDVAAPAWGPDLACLRLSADGGLSWGAVLPTIDAGFTAGARSFSLLPGNEVGDAVGQTEGARVDLTKGDVLSVFPLTIPPLAGAPPTGCPGVSP